MILDINMKTLKLLKNSFFMVLGELEVFPEILASDRVFSLSSFK